MAFKTTKKAGRPREKTFTELFGEEAVKVMAGELQKDPEALSRKEFDAALAFVEREKGRKIRK